jgi:hypothetical protein
VEGAQSRERVGGEHERVPEPVVVGGDGRPRRLGAPRREDGVDDRRVDARHVAEQHHDPRALAGVVEAR